MPICRGWCRTCSRRSSELAKAALAMVASIGGVILQFIAALIIAGVIMAFGQASDRSGRAIFARVVGREHGAEFSHLAVATIRAVAQGVIGVAFIQCHHRRGLPADRRGALGRGAG